MKNKENKIIQNTKSFFLNAYLDELTFLDTQIAEELIEASKYQFKPIIGLRLIKLLNVYCYLYDIRLPYLTFKNTNNKKLLSDFLQFCCSNFITTTLKVKQLYRNYLVRMIEKINENRIILNRKAMN